MTENEQTNNLRSSQSSYKIRGAVTQREAVAAARARVAADKLRGVKTDDRIIKLSERQVS